MKMARVTHAIAALAVGGFATGAALFAAGPATANPQNDTSALLTSTCSFAQIDAAMHKVAPAEAARLDADPAHKQLLQQAFNLPPAQRQAAFQQFLGQHPDQVQRLQQRGNASPTVAGDLRTKLREVTTTCHRF